MDVNEAYLQSHPELDSMLSSFLEAVIREKPQNARSFAAEYFGNLAPDHQTDLVQMEPTWCRANIRAFKDASGDLYFTLEDIKHGNLFSLDASGAAHLENHLPIILQHMNVEVDNAPPYVLDDLVSRGIIRQGATATLMPKNGAATLIIGMHGDYCYQFAAQIARECKLEEIELELKEQAKKAHVLDPLEFAPRKKAEVFVRVRPLIEEEMDQGDTEMEMSIDQDETAMSVSAEANGRSRTWKMKGYTGILRAVDDNVKVFDRVIEPHIQNVIAGETVCVFCYGLTSSGKTHTILGYGDEAGLYHQAASKLCAALPEDGLISVQFAEVYNNRVYDLLNDRVECAVKEDADGFAHIRATPTKDEATGDITVRPLANECGHTADEVVAIVNKGVGLRAVGSSSLHDRSSRSHAILELEVVSPELLAARERVIEAESKIHKIGSERDAFYAAQLSKMYARDENGVVTLNTNVDLDHDTMAQLDLAVGKMQVKIDDARYEEAVLSRKISGGHMVFIDLAGSEVADTTTTSGARQTATERREARQINQSLLALKECIRTIHLNQLKLKTSNGEPSRVPFRNSKLTIVLRRHLMAQLGSSPIMVSNVSPSRQHARKTINSLQYAELVGQ